MGLVVEIRPPRALPRRWFIIPVLIAMLVAPIIGPTGESPTPGSGAAWAADTGGEDLGERFKILKKDLNAHRKANALRKLREAVKAAERLYLDAESDDRLRGRIVDLVGGLTKVKGNEQIVIMGLHGLGDLGDERGARYVRGKLSQPNVKRSGVILEAAVATAADVVHPSLVGPLLKIVTKSKTFGVAADAIQSLGRYGRVEKQRVRILKTVVESVRKDRAGALSGGGSGGGARGGGGGGMSTDPEQGGSLPARSGGAANGRWRALSSVLPGAMNDLTGQDVPSVDDWIRLVKDNRGSLKDIFQLDPAQQSTK